VIISWWHLTLTFDLENCFTFFQFRLLTTFECTDLPTSFPVWLHHIYGHGRVWRSWGQSQLVTSAKKWQRVGLCFRRTQFSLRLFQQQQQITRRCQLPSVCERDVMLTVDAAVRCWVSRRVVPSGVTPARSQLESRFSRPTTRRRAALRPKSPLNVCCGTSKLSTSLSSASWTVCSSVDWRVWPAYHRGSDAVADGLQSSQHYHYDDDAISTLCCPRAVTLS